MFRRKSKTQRIKIMVEFWLSGDNAYDFDAVTDIIGVSPTRLRTKEEFQIPEFASYIWQYDTGDQDSLDIEEQLAQVSDILSRKCERIREYCDTHGIETGFCIVINSNSTQLPGTGIPKEFVSLAAQINAGIVFDIYCDSVYFDLNPE